MKINVDIFITRVEDSYKAVAKDAEGTIHATVMGHTAKGAERSLRERLKRKAELHNQTAILRDPR